MQDALMAAAVTVYLLAAIRIQVIWEERHLLRLHGQPYQDYASRTGRFVPGLGRLRALGDEASAVPERR